MKKVRKRKITKKRTKKDQYNILDFINLIIGILFSFIVFLSNINKLGLLGSVIRNIILYLFGTFGYLFPVYLIIYSIFIYKKISSFRRFMLFLFYIFVSSTISIFIFVIDYNIEYIDLIKANIIPKYFSLTSENLQNGIIINSINWSIYKISSDIGLYLFNIIISIATFIICFGLKSISVFTTFLNDIILFIPRLIKYINKKREEDLLIEDDNEKELNKTLKKLKNNKYINNDDINDNDEDEIINVDDILKNTNNDKFNTHLNKPNVYDTSNVQISVKDIQSRFYNQSSDKKNIDEDNKEEIRKQIKEKSINEIYSNNNIKPNDLFYQKHNQVNDNINIDDSYYDIINSEKPNVHNSQNNFDYDNENIPDLIDNYIQNDDSIEKTIENISSNEKTINDSHKDNNIDNQIKHNKPKKIYKFPPLAYLNKSVVKKTADKNYINEKAQVLQNTLTQFGVGAKVTNVSVGPTVTRFELLPDVGVRVKKILDLQDDIKLAMAATEIRIEAPIPGKSAIGIEVPNKETNSVLLGDILSTNEYKEIKSKLKCAIGRDIAGKIITCDISKMPHLLVAGSTGSGKSVCINSIIMSIIYNASPEDVRLIMVDPKVVELQIYNDIPHLLIPVVTDPKKAAAALNWAVGEMMRRYNLIVEKQFRDTDSYNEYVEEENKKIVDKENQLEKLPKIVIIIDEFADLMMVASKDVENAIFRIAQLARACGIHLIIATQRPSVNVISGSIKANVPGRIAFAVSSGVDSKTILDQYGAEKLLGKGDMLYSPSGLPKPIRVQGCFVSDTEIKKVVEFIKDPNPEFDIEIENSINNSQIDNNNDSNNENGKDELFVTAGKLIITSNSASSGFLQRKLQIGFNRASRILDQLAEENVVSEQNGKKSREILMTIDEFIAKFEK